MAARRGRDTGASGEGVQGGASGEGPAGMTEGPGPPAPGPAICGQPPVRNDRTSYTR